MKALILNSGLGTRMGDLVKDRPKCLVKLGKETILGRQLRLLKKQGINKVLMTTGPFEDKIKAHVKSSGLEFTFVCNPEYSTTNYIYSLYLCRNMINSDIILMHGDMAFDEKVLEMLLKSREKNCALVDNLKPVPQKDFKAEIKNGIIARIGVDVFGENCRFMLPMYKLEEQTFLIWLAKIVEFVESGKRKVYAEEAFNDIHDKIMLKPVYFENMFCMEIDNAEDLRIARDSI